MWHTWLCGCTLWIPYHLSYSDFSFTRTMNCPVKSLRCYTFPFLIPPQISLTSAVKLPLSSFLPLVMCFMSVSGLLGWNSFSYWCSKGAGIACWLECWTHDRKVVSSNPGRSGGRILFSRVNFVCWLLFGVRSTPALPQWQVKDPAHSAKSAGSRLHLNTHTSLPHWSQSGLTMLLSRQSIGIYQETSSHAPHQGTLVYSRLSLLSRCGLIPA